MTEQPRREVIGESLKFFREQRLMESKPAGVREVDFSLWTDTGRGMPDGALAVRSAAGWADTANGLRPRRG